MKRKLVQGSEVRFTGFTREVAMGSKRRRLIENNQRRAIRWFGVLRKLLMDPSYAEPGDGDLFHHATAVDHQNYRRMTGPPPRQQPFERKAKKVERRDWDRD